VKFDEARFGGLFCFRLPLGFKKRVFESIKNSYNSSYVSIFTLLFLQRCNGEADMNLEECADDIAAQIRRLLADAIKEGESRAIARVLAAARGDDDQSESADSTYGADRGLGSESVQERQRVPKGTVEPFVDRVLKEIAPDGLEPQEILEFAETDDEKLVKASSIRGCLRRGESIGKYRKDGKRSFWVDDKPEMKKPAVSDDLLNGTSQHAYRQGEAPMQ
jgi:hypothetical protein